MPKKKIKMIDLALQGGGAHGAFTWGVLDRFLDESTLQIEGISGTSAGSINAALLACGLTQGGSTGAKKMLEDFWRRVSKQAIFGPFHRGVWDILSGKWTLDHSLGYIGFDLMSRLFSPYDLNPISLNPLRMLLRDMIDFDDLAKSPVKLFINATNIRTGVGKVFRNNELRAKVLLASCCLPTLYQAVELDGEYYWDGGYTGNPAITPLVEECNSSDTIVVQINPIERLGIPRSARDIVSRENEIAFNASLLKELKMIALFRQMATDAKGKASRWANMRIHRVVCPEIRSLGHSSKLNAEWAFLVYLKNLGRSTADTFLKTHWKHLNVKSTFDIDQYTY